MRLTPIDTACGESFLMCVIIISVAVVCYVPSGSFIYSEGYLCAFFVVFLFALLLVRIVNGVSCRYPLDDSAAD